MLELSPFNRFSVCLFFVGGGEVHWDKNLPKLDKTNRQNIIWLDIVFFWIAQIPKNDNPPPQKKQLLQKL